MVVWRLNLIGSRRSHSCTHTHAQRSRVKTLERSGLSVAVYGGSILVDDTKILEWGLEASNGARMMWWWSGGYLLGGETQSAV